MFYADNSLTSYLQIIKNIPLLNRQEEKKLADKIKAGDLKARQKLVISNLKFVIQIAKKYKNSNIPLMDLVSEGNLGLMKAAETFDIKHGVNFISYAVHWIKQSILKAIAEKSNIVKIPLNWNNDLAKIYKKKNQLHNKLNQQNVKEIGKDLDIPNQKLNQLLRISAPYLSINQKVKNKEGEDKKNEVENLIPHEDSVEKTFFYKNLQKDIDKILKQLKPIEADIIRSRFGLNDQEAQTLLEIGRKYNLSKERIRQIEKNTLITLKEIMKQESIKSYLSY